MVEDSDESKGEDVTKTVKSKVKNEITKIKKFLNFQQQLGNIRTKK